jgi:mono/diheme cytochrome c family protein
MPTFRMEPAETIALGVAVGAMHATAPPAAYLKTTVAGVTLPGGKTGKLMDRFRCTFCHRIGGVGGDVSKVPLDGEGARVSRAWLEAFLASPTTLRMDQAERMPLLGMSGDDAALLAGWIASTLGDDRIVEVLPPKPEEVTLGESLFAERGCPTCHRPEAMKAPVLVKAGDRLQFAYVVAMLLRGAEVVPERRHPAAVYPESEARAMAAYVCSLKGP